MDEAVLQEMQQRLEGHVEARSVRNEPGNGTGRLWNDHHGVDQCVSDTGHGNGTEQVDSDPGIRVGQDVEEGDHEIGQDVLQVVQVGAGRKIVL